MPITKPPHIQYPVSSLDVGDSFFVPSIESSMHMPIIRALASEAGFEVAYKAGVDIDTGMYGIRVVRTA